MQVRREWLTDFTHRFDRRVAVYAKYRPSYPSQILNILRTEIGFDKKTVVADTGSGTGLLSKLFLENGNTVFGVEPNEEMWSHAEETLYEFPHFVSIRGKAEDTTLGDASIDLVTVGQAIHWFDREPATREFTRNLRKNGQLCVVYNDRNKKDPFMQSYEGLASKNTRETEPGFRMFGALDLARKITSQNTSRTETRRNSP